MGVKNEETLLEKRRARDRVKERETCQRRQAMYVKGPVSSSGYAGSLGAIMLLVVITYSPSTIPPRVMIPDSREWIGDLELCKFVAG